MPAIDAQTILNLLAALARNVAAAHVRRLDPVAPPDAHQQAILEQQILSALAPGAVAFVARLGAELPDDVDLAAILARFFEDPATAEALNRYDEDAAAGQSAITGALLSSGLPPGALDEAALAEALAAWSVATVEVARRNVTLSTNLYQQTTSNLERDQPPAIVAALQTAMSGLVESLSSAGLSRIEGGDIIAVDGYTVLFSWRRGAHESAAESAGPEEWPAGEPQEFAEAVPEEPGGSLETVPPPAPIMPPPTAEGMPPPSEPATPAAVIPLRLDTAAPPQVAVGVSFDLAAAIRRESSPPLAPDDLSLHESAPFAAVLPAGATFLAMRIQVAAPDCDIHGGDTRPVRLLPGQDGPTVYFQLTPRRPGPLSIIVTVYQETDWIGSTRLRTEVTGPAAMAMAAPRAAVTMTVSSQPLGATDVNAMTLYKALDVGYSDSELRDLCLELEVDYDDLPGQGQAAKARDLVLHCQRRGLLATLVACVMRDRPLLLVK